VSLAVLLLMGVPSAVGAVGGVFLFITVPPFWSHLMLGTVLLVMGSIWSGPGLRARPRQG
jgi:hypothetical protein